MPVISPRRSATTTSGSLYIPPSTSGTYSSSLANKTTGSSALSSSTSGYNSTYRSNGLSKTPAASTYSSYYTGSYLSRTSAYPSVGRSSYSSTSSSALTGGSSALSSYRTNSYLSGGNNDTTASSSRFGVSRYLSNRLSSKDTTPPTTTTTFTNRRRRSLLANRLLNYSNNYSAAAANTIPTTYSATTSTFAYLPTLLDGDRSYSRRFDANNFRDPTSNSEPFSSSTSAYKKLLSSDHDTLTSHCDHSTNLNFNKYNNNEFLSKTNLNSPSSQTTKPIIENNNNNNTPSSYSSSIITTIIDDQSQTKNPNPNESVSQRDLDLRTGTENTDCNNNNNSNTKSPRSSSKSRNSRVSSSYSSSSLARLVATSALDIYEKYSPAHYIPKCELSRSSSLSEAAASAAAATANAATTSTLNDKNNKNSSSNSISKNNSYSRRYSRQTNGTINENSEAPTSISSSITDNYLSVPHTNSNNNLNNSNGINANKLLLHVSYDLQDDSNSLRDLKISCISPTTTTTTTSSASSSQDTKDTAQLAKVRSSSSLRSALPPISPTPTRHWDRDSSRSSILSSRNLSDDYSSSSKIASSAILDDKPEQEGLCGLRNIGNTCFMNSVIQCLSHTSELTKFLKTQNGVRSSSSKDQQILSEFAKLIREMWTPNVNSVTPSELKRAFSSKHRMYSDYNQQDAQEFLRFFLDSLHSALNSGMKGDHLKIDENLSDNKKADITWEWYTRSENSVIRDLFVGQLKSTLRCTVCGNTSVTFDPFWDLSVPLPSSSRCKLEACLDLFIREEVLDGDEMPTCSKCQTRRKCTKSFTIQRFPKYLVIHLKRFSETRWSKMSNIVEFPTGERELNMGPYASNSNTHAHYSLYAISNHMGSTAGGHYVALCKHPSTKKWHEFNDNIVSGDLSDSHLVSSSAYILFFERAN